MKSSKPRKAVDDAEAFEANQSPDMTVHRNACQTFIQDMQENGLKRKNYR